MFDNDPPRMAAVPYMTRPLRKTFLLPNLSAALPATSREETMVIKKPEMIHDMVVREA